MTRPIMEPQLKVTIRDGVVMKNKKQKDLTPREYADFLLIWSLKKAARSIAKVEKRDPGKAAKVALQLALTCSRLGVELRGGKAVDRLESHLEDIEVRLAPDEEVAADIPDALPLAPSEAEEGGGST